MNKNTALLVVDVQHGLFLQKTPIYNESILLHRIKNIIQFCREKKVPIIYIQHANKVLLKYGTDSWKLHPEIVPLNHEIIIQKNNASAFKETDLHNILTQMKIEKLIVLGLTTHGCVKATCNDALKLGYNVTLVKDAHSSYSDKAKDLIFNWNNILSGKGIILKTTNEIITETN